MRAWFFIIFGCTLFAACGKRNETPEGILSGEKMEAVLWDIIRADQFLNDYVFNRDTSADKRKESIKLYRKVFALHKISKEEFQKSMHYYMEEPARFRTILDSVGIRKSSLAYQVKKDTVRQDTTKRLE